MNKRARNRLIGVTVIVLAIAAAVFFAASPQVVALTVKQATTDTTLIGKRVTVRGEVLPGSWDKHIRPMRFSIRTEKTKTGPTLAVVYSGSAPDTFGDGTIAIVTGTLQKGGSISADTMTTVCPTKYANNSNATTIDGILLATPKGDPVKVYGYLKPKSLQPVAAGKDRFILTSVAEGGSELRVQFEGAMPAGTKDGIMLLVGGAYTAQGLVVASDVSKLTTSK